MKRRPPPLPSCSTPDLTQPLRPQIASPDRTNPPLRSQITSPDLTKTSQPCTNPPLRSRMTSPDLTKTSLPHPTPLSPDLAKPLARGPYLSSSPEHSTHAKAPLPKPRQRKPSRSDDIEPNISPTLAKNMETSPFPPAPPVTPRTGKDRAYLSSSPSHSSSAVGHGEMLASMPAPAALRNRVIISEKVASLQIQPNGYHQREREREQREREREQREQAVASTTGGKAPPVPRKRTNKSLQESSPAHLIPEVTTPIPIPNKMSTRKRKGGGIRIALWQAPPPPSWTPPATPTVTDSSKDR